MNSIRFSHKYTKMPWKLNLNDTILLEVLTIERKDLSKEFIEYDTTFYDESGCVSHYRLPESGKLLVLLLLTSDYYLWTTLRRWTPAKEAYYQRLRGQKVECVITK